MRKNNKLSYSDIKKLEMLLNKIPDRKKISSRTLGKIITILGKHLTKIQGYSVFSTVLKREIRETGKSDANFLSKILRIENVTPETIKLVINSAAILLGLKLGIRNGKVVALECPFYEALKEYEEPFMCNACVEYNKGIAEELTNDKFTVKRVKWFFDGDNCCIFKPIRKV